MPFYIIVSKSWHRFCIIFVNNCYIITCVIRSLLLDKIILALDFNSESIAKSWVRNIESNIKIFKIGLNLFVHSGFRIVEWILARDLDVMLDLKLYDTPNTIKETVKQITKHKIKYLTIYANYYAVKAAAQVKRDTKLLVVNRLTSHHEEISHTQILSNNIIINQCINNGADGVISPCSSITSIRNTIGPKPVIITPGIRWSKIKNDDQINICGPNIALNLGADRIVVGRPVTQAVDPLKTINDIKEMLNMDGAELKSE